MDYKFETMTADTLMNTPLKPIDFVVDNLISEGLHIIAGAPKIGKSWLALWMCLQVAQGEKIWSFETKKCDVLYLCLEDSYSRIQNRLFTISDEAKGNLHFAILSNSIGNGFEEQVENFLIENPNTKFIVIDTLQKIRGRKFGSSNVYEDDYEDIGAIKKIADKNKIAILLVHHLRKSKDEDPINMVSGSSGISGSADSIFVLQKDTRTGDTATLTCVGRDIDGYELNLEFDSEMRVWKQLSEIEIAEKIVDESIITLCEYIKTKNSFTGTSTELVEALNEYTNIDYNSSVLKKKIIKHNDYLLNNNIEYIDNRNSKRRDFTLVYSV